MKATSGSLSLIGQGILLSLFLTGAFRLKAETFHTSFLVGDSAQAVWNDRDKTISPGIYDVDIYINEAWYGNQPLKVAENNQLYLAGESLKTLPLDPEKSRCESRSWLPVNCLLHGGKARFATSALQLKLTIPQAWVKERDRRWLAPELWDSGINGAWASYNFNYYHSRRKDNGINTDSLYLNLNSGLNIAGWQFIDNSNLLKNSGKTSWNTSARYIERALPALRSILRVGESYVDSPRFDSIRFSGVTLKQEPRMYPDTWRTYMPVIRGQALSNAVVKIWQNETLLRQLTVPPGPFEIDDLMPAGSRSELVVEVINAGGETERFVVPYSSVSDMLRKGTTAWTAHAGKVQISGLDYHPAFVQGEVSKGINNNLTLYGGAILSEAYSSLLLGGAFSFSRLGSFSAYLDMAQARLKREEQSRGQRWQLSWSRYFPTRTNLTLATWYYNSSDYLSFYDAVAQRKMSGNRAKSRESVSVILDQTLPEGWGRLALDGLWRQYRSDTPAIRQYSLTLSNNYRRASWSLAARRNYYDYADSGRKSYSENRLDWSLSVPFSLFASNASATLRSSLKEGRFTGLEAGLNSAIDKVDYSLSFSHDREGQTSGAGLYSAWRSPWARLSGNYSQASAWRQAGGGVSGSLVLWRGGVLASGASGDTFAILDAPGITGATVNGNSSVKTNSSGRVLVASVAPYRINRFRLAEGENGELLGNTAQVAPWAGSISYLKYKTDTRRVFTFRALQPDGRPLPFGATVSTPDSKPLGYVSQGSLLYLKADRLPDTLVVELVTDKGAKRCHIHRPAMEGDNLCTD
ncbi:fimbria/pilus outer membrane usher protein [Kalamiella sp. sgz302252]|uniref:fimbria/pilus outer membrane usher protein n=1 Tax=Pantoea sp. sgz302252 TaxID=3341827 RepID=UPI0036D3E78D